MHRLSDRGGVGLRQPQNFYLETIQVKLGHYTVKIRQFSRDEDYILLIHQLKQRIVKGSVYCICKTNLKNLKMAFSAF